MRFKWQRWNPFSQSPLVSSSRMYCKSVYVRIRADVFRTSGIWSVVVRFPWDSPIRFLHFGMLILFCPDLQHIGGCVREITPLPAHPRTTLPHQTSRRRCMSLHRCGFPESTASVCLHPIRWMLGVQIADPTNIRFWMKIRTYWDSSLKEAPTTSPLPSAPLWRDLSKRRIVQSSPSYDDQPPRIYQ